MTSEASKRRSRTEDFIHQAAELVFKQCYKVAEAAHSEDFNSNQLHRSKQSFVEQAA